MTEFINDVTASTEKKEESMTDVFETPENTIAPAEEGKPDTDFELERAKESGNIDEELYARFRKFGKMMRMGRGPKGCGPRMNGGAEFGARVEGGHRGPRPEFDGPGCGPRPGFGGPGCEGGHGPHGHGPHAGGPRPEFHGGLRSEGAPQWQPGFGSNPFTKHPEFPCHPGNGPKGGHGPHGGPRPEFGAHPGFGGPQGAPGFRPEGGPQCGPGPEGFGGNAPERKGENVHMGRGRVLATLALQDNLTQRDLAFILGIRPQSLGELLGKLEADGFITRQRSETDKRAVKVSLTDAGRARAEEIQAKRNRSAEDMFAKLTAEEKAQLRDLLAKLQD